MAKKTESVETVTVVTVGVESLAVGGVFTAKPKGTVLKPAAIEALKARVVKDGDSKKTLYAHHVAAGNIVETTTTVEIPTPVTGE